MRNIFSYIAEDNADAALKMVDSIEARALQLEDNPFIGVALPRGEYPFLQPGYHRLPINPFIMYYRVSDKTVYITHIIHSRRNQAKALIDDE